MLEEETELPNGLYLYLCVCVCVCLWMYLYMYNTSLYVLGDVASLACELPKEYYM